MFSANSRYAKLPTSSPVDAKGERLLGTNIRLIPSTSGTFLHTVLSRDRLDLLASKYYGDPSRWWQISDANSDFPFPTDVLDRAPIRDELLSLVDKAFEARFKNLTDNLANAGLVVPSWLMDVSESWLVVLSMTPAVRRQTITAIRAAGFHFVRSFAWSDGVTTGEVFYFDDLTAKLNWRLLMEDFEQTAGILEAVSTLEDGTIHVVYNSAEISREAILSITGMRGLEVDFQASQESTQIGARITVPSNTVS